MMLVFAVLKWKFNRQLPRRFNRMTVGALVASMAFCSNAIAAIDVHFNSSGPGFGSIGAYGFATGLSEQQQVSGTMSQHHASAGGTTSGGLVGLTAGGQLDIDINVGSQTTTVRIVGTAVATQATGKEKGFANFTIQPVYFPGITQDPLQLTVYEPVLFTISSLIPPKGQSGGTALLRGAQGNRLPAGTYLLDFSFGVAVYEGGDDIVHNSMDWTLTLVPDPCPPRGWAMVENASNSTSGYALSVLDIDGSGPELPSLFAALNADGQYWVSQWQDHHWEQIGLNVGGAVECMTVFDDDGSGPNPEELYIGGHAPSCVKKWNGNSWVTVGVLGGVVRCLQVFDEDGPGPSTAKLVAGGILGTTGGTGYAAQLDSAQWTLLPNAPFGINSQILAMCLYDADGPGVQSPSIILGGRYSDGGQFNQISRWDGHEWTPLGAGVGIGGSLDSVSSLTTFDPDGEGPLPNYLIAGGQFTSTNQGGFSHFISAWDGQAWNPIGGSQVQAVTDLTVFDEDPSDCTPPMLYAVGTFELKGPRWFNIFRWNGYFWSAFSLPENGPSISNLVSFDLDGNGPNVPELFAAGSDSGNGHTIARWSPGQRLCEGDIAPVGQCDAVVNIDDLLEVVNGWGQTCGHGDAVRDGIINIDDLLLIIQRWGPCQ